MRKRPALFWLITLAYFGGLSIFLLSWRWQLVWWWWGGLMGLSLIWIDRLVYVYVTRPQDQLSVYIKFLIKHKRFKEVVKTLRLRGKEQQHLVTQSFLFMVVWVAAATYVISSSGSYLASGLVLGAGLRNVGDIISGWNDKAQLKRTLFWQIKRDISDKELKVLVGLWLGVFCLLSLAMV